MEFGVPGLRRPGQEAHGSRLAGPVCVWTCVYMCVCVRHALCSPFPLTSKSQAPLLQRVFSAVLASAWWVPAALSGNVAGDTELSPNSVEAVGPDLGRGANLFLCGHPSSGAPAQACHGSWHLCICLKCSKTVLGVFWVLSLSGVQFPDLLLLFCESVVPFGPTLSLPFGKHSGSLARMTSGGSLQLTFIHDTP